MSFDILIKIPQAVTKLLTAGQGDVADVNSAKDSIKYTTKLKAKLRQTKSRGCTLLNNALQLKVSSYE